MSQELVPLKIVKGICLGLLGGFIDNLGVCIMKIAHRRIAEKPLKISYWKSPLWLAGLALYLGGNVVNAVGLSLTPQSVFAVVGAIGLVTNAVNSRIILKEKMNTTMVLGLASVIGGSILAVLFGPHAEAGSDLTFYGVWRLFTPGFIAYLATMVAFGIFCLVMLRRIEKSAPTRFVSLDRASGDLPASIVMRRRDFRSKATTVFLSVGYPFVAGIIGSFTVVFAKILFLVIGTFKERAFATLWLYLAVAGVVISGGTQIILVNLGLRNYEQLLVVPAFAVSLETFNIITGLLFFQEFRGGFPLLHCIFFPLAIVTTFVGVIIITMGRHLAAKFSSTLSSRLAEPSSTPLPSPIPKEVVL